MVPHIHTVETIPSQQPVGTQRKTIYSAVAVVLQYMLVHIGSDSGPPLSLVIHYFSVIEQTGYMQNGSKLLSGPLLVRVFIMQSAQCHVF